MGKADYLVLGDHNAVCAECGMKFKASELKKHWRGYYVCERHWEPRHPQDFVRARAVEKPPTWIQVPVDIETRVRWPTSIAGCAVAGGAESGNTIPCQEF